MNPLSAPSLTDVPHLFAQLQARYPTSSLVTELLQVHAQGYVVRAQVLLGSVPLVSGMAVAADLELAEDRARSRALELLGIQPARLVSLPSPTVPIPSTFALDVPEATYDQEQSQIQTSTPVPATFSNPLPATAPDTTLAFFGYEAPTPTVEPDLVQTDPVLPEQDEPPTDEVDADWLAATDALEQESLLSESESIDAEPVTNLTETGRSLSNPEDLDDLSSLISQTDLEMERIGWTKRQGRNHLKRTYQKDTRSELNTEELLDFLHYLKACSSANGL